MQSFQSAPGLKSALQFVVAKNIDLRSKLMVGRIRQLSALSLDSARWGSKGHYMSSHEDDVEEARTCAVQLQELKSTVRLHRARQSVIDLSSSALRGRGRMSQLQLERAQHVSQFAQLAQRISTLRRANRVALGMVPTPFGRRNFRVLPLASLRPVVGRVSVPAN